MGEWHGALPRKGQGEMTYKEQAEYWENIQLARFLAEIEAQELGDEADEEIYNDNYDEIIGENDEVYDKK